MTPVAALRIAACALLFAAAAGCARQGRELFIREGCVSCHRYRGIGSGNAPDLSDVGSRRDAAWIRRQIHDPMSNNPRSRMPAFPRLDWLDLRSLSSFLTQR